MLKKEILENKTIDALCVTLCTDDPLYIDEDSHYIHIPKSLFISYTNYLNLNLICFELSNPKIPTGTKIYLKKIEPSMSEFESNILLPDWVCKKLSIEMCGDIVNIIPITRPNKIKRCKIRGDNSSYVKMDIKVLLEDKINKFKCINFDTSFTINSIKFTIIELISTNDELVNYGITTDELEIDFDTPDDIKFAERRKSLTEKITKKIEDKINSINEFKSKFNAKKTGIFKFNDYMESQHNQLAQFNPTFDWDELDNILKLELEKEYSSNPIELEENIKILADLIEEGKSIKDKIPIPSIPSNTSNILAKTETKTKTKINLFNTKPRKLSDTIDSDSNESAAKAGNGDGDGDEFESESKSIVLTKEEIKRIRLEKLTKKH